MYTIYLITNKVNGKVYVGQTVRPLHQRWAEHLSYSRRDKDFPLYRAMRKHGPENFTCEEILQAESKEQADYQERIWIILLRAHTTQDGYVCTWGGDGRTGPSPITRWKRLSSLRTTLAKDPTKHSRYRSDIDTSEIVRLYGDEGWTRQQIADYFKCSPQLITQRTKFRVGRGRHSKDYVVPEASMAAFRESHKGKDSPTFRQDLKTEEMVFLYESGLTLQEIGSKLGCTGAAVRYRLKNIGMILRPSNNISRNKEQ